VFARNSASRPQVVAAAPRVGDDESSAFFPAPVAIVIHDGWNSVLDDGPDGALVGRLGLADIFTERGRKKLIQKCGYWWRSKVTTTLDGETLTIVVTGRHPRTLRLDLHSATLTRAP
jgi:hypothetical protein